MKTTLLILIALMTLSTKSYLAARPTNDTSLSPINQETILGDWSGALDLGPMKLTMIVHVSKNNSGELIATFACPEQHIESMPIEKLQFEKNEISFEIKTIKAKFQGFFESESNSISGNFLQAEQKLPLILSSGIKIVEPIKRFQEPTEPFPYHVEEVSFQNSESKDVTLAGTLTKPLAEGPFPTALLIPGSGPNNRNEEVCGHKIFLVLADHLTRQGIAVLRVDKRGVGQSTGNYELATTKDFATDARAAIDYLKTRPDVDLNKIGLIGHSEGGLVTAMVGANNEDIAFAVLMASPGVSCEDVLIAQGALIQKSENVPQEHIELEQKLRTEIFKVVKEETDPKIVEERLEAVFNEFVASLPTSQRKEAGENSYEELLERNKEQTIQNVNSPWLRFALVYNPSADFQQMKAPVLALNGELDLQVPPEQNLPAIEEALSLGGNPDYTVINLPKHNHLFQTCETGAISEYAMIEETLSPKALNHISSWILDRFGSQ